MPEERVPITLYCINEGSSLIVHEIDILWKGTHNILGSLWFVDSSKPEAGIGIDHLKSTAVTDVHNPMTDGKEEV